MAPFFFPILEINTYTNFRKKRTALVKDPYIDKRNSYWRARSDQASRPFFFRKKVYVLIVYERLLLDYKKAYANLLDTDRLLYTRFLKNKLASDWFALLIIN